jgi:DNA-directed RNA polymerase sigma subunit (sigma70/sigma32)
MVGLNEKERYIIEHRVTSDDPLTLQDIADHFRYRVNGYGRLKSGL